MSYGYDVKPLQPLEVPAVVAQQGETVPYRGTAYENVQVGDDVADTIRRKFFKALNDGGIAVKSVDYPICIREIAQRDMSHHDLSLFILSAAGKPRLIDVSYQFVRVARAVPAAGSCP